MFYRHKLARVDCIYVIRERDGIKYFALVESDGEAVDNEPCCSDHTNADDCAFELNRDLRGLVPIITN